MKNQKFDFKDITIVPETISSIETRSVIDIFDENGKLPIMVSPMDTVIDEYNCDVFSEEGLNVCMPRGINPENDDFFMSISLDDFEKMVEWFDDSEIQKNL